MTIQYSVAVRNAALDSHETAIGVSPILTIRTGAKPTNCAATNSGTVLATMALPSDWMSAAAAGVKSLLGTWQDVSADNTGLAAHFRIHDSSGVNCHIQGSISLAGGGGDMIVDNSSFVAGQTFTVISFTLTAGNA